MKVCFRCKKKIETKSDYYSFTEFAEGKKIKIDFAHRVCWDEFLKKVSSLENAQNFLSKINIEPLRNLGLIKDEEVIIK